MVELSDVPDFFHVSSVTPRPENNTDLCARIDIVGGDECSRRVVDKRGDFDRDVLAAARVCCIKSGLRLVGCRPTCLARECRNISATSRPSVFFAPNPFVQRMSLPWSIRSCLQ